MEHRTLHFTNRLHTSTIARCLACLALACCMLGCPPKRPAELNGPTDEPLPTYTQLAEAHNNRVRQVTQIWSRSVVEVEWTDDDGKDQFEQGEGPFIYRRPRDLALAIGKLGKTYIWVGSNADRYWLMMLNPPDDQPRTAHVGRHDKAANVRSLPFPISPTRLIDLLGLGLLPEAPGDGATVTRGEGGAVLTMPWQAGGEQKGRIAWQFDEALRLRRIVMTRDDRQAWVTVALDRYEPLVLANMPPGGWPDIATRITIDLPLSKAHVKLVLSEPSDGVEAGRVKDVQFNLERLVKALGVERVVDLDAQNRPPPGD